MHGVHLRHGHDRKDGESLPTPLRGAGVELSPAMIDVARKRAEELNRQVDLRLGDAEALEFAECFGDLAAHQSVVKFS
jgi:ubiquinone/menaquinone biosynthesis C-methylase UbiE